MKKFLLLFSAILLVGAGCRAGADQEAQPSDSTNPNGQVSVEENLIQDGKSGSTSDDLRTYSVNLEESVLEWKGNALLKSHEGDIKLSSGTLEARGTEVLSGEFVIDMKSMRCTDLEGPSADSLIEHLSNSDFFDTEAYPEARFVLTSTETTDTANEYVFVGNLTIKDTTEEIRFPATVLRKSNLLAATASFSVDRTKWGVTYGSGSFFDDLGDKAIDDMIEFTLSVVASRDI